MVDSSWKSRGNVSVHSANNCSSLGPNFRTWACKAIRGSSAFGEGCLGGGGHSSHCLSHSLRIWAVRGAAAMAEVGWASCLLCARRQRRDMGMGADHSRAEGDRHTFGMGVISCL